jgi:hypothetical protein
MILFISLVNHINKTKLQKYNQLLLLRLILNIQLNIINYLKTLNIYL